MIFRKLLNRRFRDRIQEQMSVQLTFVLFLFVAAGTWSCNKPAESGKEAAEILTGIKTWKIYEIRANDAPIFKDGKMLQQFGGIEFNRYMVEVSLNRNGAFEGKFNEGGPGSRLVWRQENDKIIVAAADVADTRGQWTILAKDVFKDRFMMQTTTTAYNYPNTTKVGLYFKSE